MRHIREYYKEGKVAFEKWYNEDGEVHRENAPAEIWYYTNGSKWFEMWKKNGIIHRENGPAIISYYENGNIRTEKWFLNGKLHREDGPAVIEYSPDGGIKEQEYYINDEKISPYTAEKLQKIKKFLKNKKDQKKISL